MNKKLIIVLIILALLLAVGVLIFNNLSLKTELSPNVPAVNRVDQKTNQAINASDVKNNKKVTKISNNSEIKVVPTVKVPEANLNAMPGSADGPKQEKVQVNQIPKTAIKLTVSAKGFSPAEFSVKAHESVTLAITSTDTSPHVFIFPNSSLMSLTSMILGRETKMITFIAPSSGTYNFRDDLPSFRQNVGKMIVN